MRSGLTSTVSRATTRRAGARRSTRPGWSTRRRARQAPGGSARRGTRRSGRRGGVEEGGGRGGEKGPVEQVEVLPAVREPGERVPVIEEVEVFELDNRIEASLLLRPPHEDIPLRVG